MIILDLTEKLVDRLIQLSQTKQKMDEREFKEHVEPVFLELEKVHEHYLQSFRNFRKMLSNKEALYTIIDKIKEEYIFSEGQRAKLQELTRIKNVGSQELLDFYSAIYFYLTAVHDDSNVLNSIEKSPLHTEYYLRNRHSQRWFHGAIDGLIKGEYRHDGGHEVNVQDSIYVLDGLVEQLQDSYRTICSRYVILKNKLLK